MNRHYIRLTRRLLYVAGMLLMLATYVLRALPADLGLFLGAACFIVGSLFSAECDGARERRDV